MAQHPTSRLADPRRLACLVGLGGILALTACSAASGAAPATGAGSASGNLSLSPTAAVGATTAPVASAGSPVAASTKVNANTASQDQVQAALAANGVPNAARWAVEVVEYRPYPTDDPSLAKLRQNLAKYNPAPGVVDQIIASLSL